MARRYRKPTREERLQDLHDEYNLIGDTAQAYRTPEEQQWARRRLKEILAEMDRVRQMDAF